MTGNGPEGTHARLHVGELLGRADDADRTTPSRIPAAQLAHIHRPGRLRT